uniref:Retrovirus-related Pol polyprotein from transposon TNT 1-94-like beta-barrel domain-containing protein n=1 Tax=Ananas comosus var. bracteatus TaxID=296719 RepID=A0A6V7P0Z1_ANACO|nr:unnamed protein product [Ananas comosus var. bracteatus]
MTGNRDFFVDLHQDSSSQVKLGNGKLQQIEGKGVIAVYTKGGEASRLDSINWHATLQMRRNLENPNNVRKEDIGSSLDITFRRRWFRRIIGVLDIQSYTSTTIAASYSITSSPSRCTFKRCRCTMAFSAFMRNMLRTEEDVKLLRQRGILASSSIDRQPTH